MPVVLWIQAVLVQGGTHGTLKLEIKVAPSKKEYSISYSPYSQTEHIRQRRLFGQ